MVRGPGANVHMWQRFLQSENHLIRGNGAKVQKHLILFDTGSVC